MKNIKTLLTTALVASMFFSCQKSDTIDGDLNIPDLGGKKYDKTEIDNYLEATFRKPYNIDVQYRWNVAEIQEAFDRPLVPIKESYVVPFMQTINDVWFDPYIKTAGLDFVKLYTPKSVVLAGSAEYQNGSIKLGQAEGGRKILLLNVNQFDATDAESVKHFLHTIEHEFAHIMHQNQAIDPKFEKISAGNYNPSGWTDINYDSPYTNSYEPKAYLLGFISAYSASGKDEDFVEMMSRIMVYGRDWFETVVIPGAAMKGALPDAVANLRAKETAVVDYLRDKWNVRFYDDPLTGQKGLVTYVQEAIAATVAKNQTN